VFAVLLTSADVVWRGASFSLFSHSRPSFSPRCELPNLLARTLSEDRDKSPPLDPLGGQIYIFSLC